jgi:hypothetical protein
MLFNQIKKLSKNYLFHFYIYLRKFCNKIPTQSNGILEEIDYFDISLYKNNYFQFL